MRRYLRFGFAALLASCSAFVIGSSPAQAIPPLGNDDYDRTLPNVHSHRFAAVYGASRSNGAAIVQWSWNDNGVRNEEWRFDNVDPYGEGNWYRIWNLHSGKCMVVKGASKANGADIVQWDCQDGTPDNEVWYKEFVTEGGQTQQIWRNRHSGKCLVVSGASTLNGAKLIQWDCPVYNGVHNEYWI